MFYIWLYYKMTSYSNNLKIILSIGQTHYGSYDISKTNHIIVNLLSENHHCSYKIHHSFDRINQISEDTFDFQNTNSHTLQLKSKYWRWSESTPTLPRFAA